MTALRPAPQKPHRAGRGPPNVSGTSDFRPRPSSVVRRVPQKPAGNAAASVLGANDDAAASGSLGALYLDLWSVAVTPGLMRPASIPEHASGAESVCGGRKTRACAPPLVLVAQPGAEDTLAARRSLEQSSRPPGTLPPYIPGISRPLEGVKALDSECRYRYPLWPDVS